MIVGRALFLLLACPAAALARVRGIDADSVRAAAQPLALSFAFDPAAQTTRSALRDIERHAKVPGMKLTLLRTVR